MVLLLLLKHFCGLLCLVLDSIPHAGVKNCIFSTWMKSSVNASLLLLVQCEDFPLFCCCSYSAQMLSSLVNVDFNFKFSSTFVLEFTFPVNSSWYSWVLSFWVPRHEHCCSFSLGYQFIITQWPSRSVFLNLYFDSFFCCCKDYYSYLLLKSSYMECLILLYN